MRYLVLEVRTCKLIVKFEYWDERLTEPSSCWFPLKSPSGYIARPHWQFYQVKRMIRGLEVGGIHKHSRVGTRYV